MYKLDSFDLKILELIQINNKITSEVLAKKVGLSSSACQRRINSMRKAKIIKKDISVIDQNVIGRQITIVVQVLSDKEGIGIDELMESITNLIPPPEGNEHGTLQALLFDAWYDSFRGVIVLIKVQHGILKVGDEITMMATDNKFMVEELGTFNPKQEPKAALQAGEVGYLIAGIKQLDQTKVGDTITHAKSPAEKPLPGYKEVKPMVFSGLYPISGDDYEDLRDSLKKLTLNDASFSYEAETSTALGFGFRCGFLGLLHMEIIRERIEREYQVDLLTTAPTVIYKVITTDGKTIMIDNPTKLKEQKNIDHLVFFSQSGFLHLTMNYITNYFCSFFLFACMQEYN